MYMYPKMCLMSSFSMSVGRKSMLSVESGLTGNDRCSMADRLVLDLIGQRDNVRMTPVVQQLVTEPQRMLYSIYRIVEIYQHFVNCRIFQLALFGNLLQQHFRMFLHHAQECLFLFEDATHSRVTLLQLSRTIRVQLGSIFPDALQFPSSIVLQ